MEQVGIDEYLASTRARELSIDRAEFGAGDDWLTSAVEAIWATSETLSLFSSDHVRKMIADPPEPRAWGAAFRKAAKLGFIVATKDHHIPNRISSHRRPMRLWRSLHPNFLEKA